MNRPILGLFSILLLQSEGIEAQSKWCQYETRSLGEIVEDAVDAMPDAEVAFSVYQKPSRAWLRYTGEQRPINDSLRSYLMTYSVFFGDPGYHRIYEREFLFREGFDEYWIPVQEMMVPQFITELSPDDSTEAFALWTGAYRSGARWRWVFLLRDFTSTATADFWQAELAKCIVAGPHHGMIRDDSLAPNSWVRQPPVEGVSRDELAARVDTLVVTPDTVLIRVGETFPLVNLGITALDSLGNVINGILPTFTVYPSDAVTPEGLGLRGVQPGVSQFTVVAEPARAQQDSTGPTTVVVVVVIP